MWNQCYLLGESDIKNYEAHRRKNPSPQPSKTWAPPKIDNPPPPRWLLDEVDDWRSYVAAVDRCNWWWKRWSKRHHPNNPWSVLGETKSWRETIQELHDVVKDDWSNLSDYNQKRLRGLGGAHWALLGDLKRVSAKRLFGSNRKKIQKVLIEVAENDSVSLDEAITAYRFLTDKKDGKSLVGTATATRLLALARPDRFVSLNGGSSKGLARCFGPDTPTALGISKNGSGVKTCW